ncbi:MAG: MarR family transcriptional regulator [Gallionella sp.]
MSPKIFLPLLRELMASCQAFTAYSSTHIRTLDLTPPQFDIIATLGNTTGMSFKELGDNTLITKGTLTGVVDRLTLKGLVQRVAHAQDGRSQMVQLTEAGNALFAQHFPAHLQHIAHALAPLSKKEMRALTDSLRTLRAAFATASSEEKP